MFAWGEVTAIQACQGAGRSRDFTQQIAREDLAVQPVKGCGGVGQQEYDDVDKRRKNEAESVTRCWRGPPCQQLNENENAFPDT